MIYYNSNTIKDWNFGDDNIIKVYKGVKGAPPTPRLPEGYTEVEYIRNSGYNAYIDTGVILFDNTQNTYAITTKLSSEFHSNLGCATIISCEEPVSPYYGLGYRYKCSSTVDQLEFYGADSNYESSVVDNGDGTRTVSFQSTGATTWTIGAPISLFCSFSTTSYDTSSAFRYSDTTIYSSTIVKNGETVRDFVPAKRDSDSVYGLYDLINSVFYASPNGNNFSGGAAVTPTSSGYTGVVCYYKIVTSGGTTSQTPCFAVVDDISQYEDTEFEDVFNKADEKWYKLNNLNEYEEYGIYGSGRTITTYEGKLTLDDGYEYIYSGGSWVNVGEVSGGTIPDSYIIEFADSNVKTICVNNWGGNVVTGEITYGEAKQVTSLGAVFARNTTITSFNELAYFTSLQSISNGEFVGCRNLTDIVIPSNVTTLGTNTSNKWIFSGCTNLSGVTILSGDDSLYLDMTACNGSYYMNSSHSSTPMIFPNRSMEFSNSTFGYYDYLATAYFQSQTPPINLANSDINNYRKLATVYCPVGAYNAYSNALSGKNKTIIEYDFETDSNNVLAKEKEWIGKTSSATIYPLYYDEIQDPPSSISFSSMTEAEEYECPYVGLDADIDGTDYIFDENYNWVTKYGLFEVSGYVCDSGDKYQKMEEKVRNVDDTWSSQDPPVYEKGALIESASTDCRRYDAEIEYLQSTGTQYINTNIFINTSNFEVGYNILGNQLKWGYTHQGSGGGTWIWVDPNTAFFGNFNNGRVTIAPDNNENIIKYISQSGITVNNIFSSKSFQLGSDSISSIPLYFFGGYDFRNGIDYGSTKLKSFYLKNNGELVLDMIPVRIGQVGYMYDKVSGELFGNAGSGDFILGADK